MDMQNVSNLQIPEGIVRTIHDKDNRLLWGRVAYNTKYDGNTDQQTYSGWQMLGGDGMATPFSDTTYWSTTSGFTQTPLQNGWARLSNTSGSSMQFANCFIKTQVQFQASSTYTVVIELTNVEAGPRRLAFAAPASSSDSVDSYQFISCPDGVTEQTDGAVWYRSSGLVAGEYVLSFTTKNALLAYLPRMYFMYPVDGKSFDMRMSIIQGNHSYDWQNYCGNNWQPFVGGGIPSPNPDYPQDIQVVTGEQTVTVSDGTNAQNFTVNLGATELCKIGEYQDYIYKSGDDWYVRKEIGKNTADGDTVWTSSSFGTNAYSFAPSPASLSGSTGGVASLPILFSSHFNRVSYNDRTVNVNNITYGAQTGIIIVRNTPFTSTQSITSFCANNNPVWYYALATPTNTKITDDSLVGQLNAAHQWLTRYGYGSAVTGNLPIIIDRTNL